MTEPTESALTQDDFTRELTELCRKHRLGIEGGAVYVMEHEDYPHVYALDAESKLVRE